MNYTNTEISLTYLVGEECLIHSGSYNEAKIEVKNPNRKLGTWTQISPTMHSSTSGESIKITTPMKTRIQAVYARATQHTMLSNAFIRMCLEKPTKPPKMGFARFSRTPEGRFYMNWMTFSDEYKIKYNIEKYVSNLGGTLVSYELLD